MTRTTRTRALGTAAVIVAMATASAAQSRAVQSLAPMGTGLRAVTEASYPLLQQEVTAPDFKPGIINQPLMIRLDALSKGTAEPYDFVDDMPDPWKNSVMMNLRGALPQVEDFPYSVSIETPYLRVAQIASEAKRRFETPTFPPLATIQVGVPAVVVTSGTNFLRAESIDNVVIKRAGQIVRPLSKTLTPSTIRNQAGSEKSITTGRFVFDQAVFEPTSPIEIVLIGPSTNRPWPMTRQELGALR